MKKLDTSYRKSVLYNYTIIVIIILEYIQKITCRVATDRAEKKS